MIGIVSRRGFVAGAMLASAGAASLPASARARRDDAVLLFDAGLVAGARFAAHARALGRAAEPLEGDRVRTLHAVLSGDPGAIFAVTRHSDQWLIGEIAREAGYRRVSLIQHDAAGAIIPTCAPDGAAIATLARLAGSRWPEAFAELAVGGLERTAAITTAGASEPAFSWILARDRAL